VLARADRIRSRSCSSITYQRAAERRRQLAAEIGELTGDFITTLLGAKRSERDAREASVHDLAITRTCARQSPWRTDGREQS